MSTQFSLYIPTINKKYTIENIITTFWKLDIGNVDRIDFVPIMKTYKDEQVEDTNFRQAFIYITPNTNWNTFVIGSIEKNGSFRLFPHQETSYDRFYPLPGGSVQEGNPREYWILLKNKNPVPYSTTSLNIHQLAHNNELLETKVSEMEEEMLKMKEEITRLKEENNAMSCQMRADIERNWDRCHGFTEEEAESFVNSWENILKMSEEGNTNEEYDEEYEDQREREEDLVYDDSGEMTPRGRVIKTGL